MTDPSPPPAVRTDVPLPLRVYSLEHIAVDHRPQYRRVYEPSLGSTADGTPVPGREVFELAWITEDDRLNYFRHYVEIAGGRLLVVPAGMTPESLPTES